jgi:hypothetical protein
VVGNHGTKLEVAGSFQIPLAELREAWEQTLPALFSGPVARPLDPTPDPAEGADDDSAPE